MYKYLLKVKLDRFYKNYSREKRFLNLKDIQSILILFDTADYEAVDGIVDNLEKLGKKITVYAYKGKKDEYDYSETPYHIITAKSAGAFFDNKMSKIADELKEQQYHAVIDLTTKRNIPLEYLLAHANAFLKAGLKKNDYPQYDLSMTTLPEAETETPNVNELGNQIIHYLRTIQAK